MDERFVGACYYSDDDYCRRANDLYGEGCIGRAKKIPFLHEMSVEGKALGVTDQMQINNNIYRDKWRKKE